MSVNAETIAPTGVDNGGMTSEERRRLADHIEASIWPVIYPATRDGINLGQLRVNILDALEAALRLPETTDLPTTGKEARALGYDG